MTHKSVASFNRTLRRHYGYKGKPVVIKATEIADASLMGIHLLNPTEGELFDAIETLQRDGYPRIVVHTKRTFRKVA